MKFRHFYTIFRYNLDIFRPYQWSRKLDKVRQILVKVQTEFREQASNLTKFRTPLDFALSGTFGQNLDKIKTKSRHIQNTVLFRQFRQTLEQVVSLMQCALSAVWRLE